MYNESCLPLCMQVSWVADYTASRVCRSVSRLQAPHAAQ